LSKKLEIKPWLDEESGRTVNAIYLDGRVFDWGLVEDGILRAKEYIVQNPMVREVVYGDIQKHFLDSLSEFVGREVTLKELNAAIEKGYIE
jgi:aminopeptidase-like protein